MLSSSFLAFLPELVLLAGGGVLFFVTIGEGLVRRARLVALHPYELPELLAVQADGPPAYLQWLARETAPASP